MWEVETFDHRVDEELAELSADLKGKFLHIAELLEEFGPHKVKEPYTKFLESGLWEMRMRGSSGIARALYTIKGQRLIVLHLNPAIR